MGCRVGLKLIIVASQVDDRATDRNIGECAEVTQDVAAHAAQGSFRYDDRDRYGWLTQRFAYSSAPIEWGGPFGARPDAIGQFQSIMVVKSNYLE